MNYFRVCVNNNKLYITLKGFVTVDMNNTDLDPTRLLIGRCKMAGFRKLGF